MDMINASNKILKILLGFSVVFCLKLSAQTTTQRNLDSLFKVVSARGDLSGSVLITENGKPIYQKSFGYADIGKMKPVTDQSVFELASLSKQFIAMGIMQLEEKKKLSYADKIGKYLPISSYSEVTIKNILQHTSGIPDFFGWNETIFNKNKAYSNSDILKILAESDFKPDFKPDEKLGYSNTNYVLLALIIEKVSGMNLKDYMDKNIFSPLKMSSTSVYAQRSEKKKYPDYALGYVYDSKTGNFVVSDSVNAFAYVRYFDKVNGPYGISSNAEDLLKWDQALNSTQLVKNITPAFEPARLANGETGKVGNIPYGFGWLIGTPTADKGRKYFHSGGYPGYSNMIVRYPDKKKTIILLTNKWNAINVIDLTWEIENIIYGKPFSVPAKSELKKSISLNPAQIKAIEGNFIITGAPQVKIQISSDFDHVYAQITGQPRVEIFPESETAFFYTVVKARIVFTKNDRQ